MKARAIRLSVYPSDWMIIALLALAVMVAAVRWLALGPQRESLLLAHLGLLLGFLACAALLARWQQHAFVGLVRPVLTVAIIFTLYTSLGKLGMAAMPYRFDAVLSELDTRLCGVDPSLFVQRYQTPGWVEFFSFIYGAFIPYIYLSMFLGCLGRPPHERDQFLTGWVITYTVSYLGYISSSAQGPAAYHADDYQVTLAGGFFYKTVLEGVKASGGLQGAFPSLHVGGSLYLCLFDLKTNRLRGLTYLPMVLLIYLSTIFLRYHYIVDLIVGTVIAFVSVPLGQGVFARWARQRQAAGLPALPGGEGDDLSAFSSPGAAGTGQLLPAN